MQRFIKTVILLLIAAFIMPPAYQFATGKISIGTLFSEHYPNCVSEKLDGIAVFTGGVSRVDYAYTLFESAKEQNEDVALLISTNHKTALPENTSDGKNVTIDRHAFDTMDNGIITAEWSRENNIGNLCLITDAPHMARAVFEIKAARPDLKISTFPVFGNPASHYERTKFACRIYEDFLFSFPLMHYKPGTLCRWLKDQILGPETFI